jgi:phosphoribosylanthranilate isomerase
MSRTRIKICGVTRAEDARAASDAGADAVGMVFHEASARNVPLERAREIIAAIGPFVVPVGVFVDAEAATILRITTELGVRIVQLNGRESPALVRELKTLKVIKAIRVERQSCESDLASWRGVISSLKLSNLVGLVLEPGHTGQPGGSGVANDWETVRQNQERGSFNDLPPIIAAGGLTANTVAEVVRTIRPWAVDVSSGIEETRGVKSARKIQAFVRAVREADGVETTDEHR